MGGEVLERDRNHAGSRPDAGVVAQGLHPRRQLRVGEDDDVLVGLHQQRAVPEELVGGPAPGVALAAGDVEEAADQGQPLRRGHPAAPPV